MPQFLTTKQVADIIGAAEWRVRRVVDSLAEPIQRFGHKRMIPAALVDRIRDEVARIERRQEAVAS